LTQNFCTKSSGGDKILLWGIGANGKGKSTPAFVVIDGSEKTNGEATEGYNVIKSFFLRSIN